MPVETLADAVSAYGASLKSKLSNPAISGSPEDQLRGPLETLIKDLTAVEGLPAGNVHLVGETSLSDLKTRLTSPSLSAKHWSASSRSKHRAKVPIRADLTIRTTKTNGIN